MSTDAGYGRNVSDEHSGKYRVLEVLQLVHGSIRSKGAIKGDTRPLSRPLTWISLGLGEANFLLVVFPYEGNRGDGNKR